MKIDGREIAKEIYDRLSDRVGELGKIGLTPHLVVLLVGKDPGSLSYIRQKKKFAEKIGALVTVQEFEESTTTEKLLNIITRLNSDSSVHGVILQLPIPKHLAKQTLLQSVAPQKDIDGFNTSSPYKIPVAMAVEEILKQIYSLTLSSREVKRREISEISQPSFEMTRFVSSLQSQSIVILGKGETAGSPIIRHFHKMGINPTIIDSKTQNPELILKQADIIISCVGKKIITPDKIKEGSILIGVGLHTEPDGKLHGDFDEETIEKHVSFYTPTPGGVGPVNVSMLLSNLLTAAEKAIK